MRDGKEIAAGPMPMTSISSASKADRPDWIDDRGPIETCITDRTCDQPVFESTGSELTGFVRAGRPERP
jgi:hypothetical protein